MSVPICNHLKEDGVFCGSPALNGRKYCYFHLNQRVRRFKAARARRRGDNPPLNLPFPEDMHAVQISLAEIMWAIAERRIDHKDAGLLLYMLQQASTNLNQTPRWQGQREAVENQRPLRAINLPDFEKRFGLPDNVDLDADPEVAFPPPSSLSQSVILSSEEVAAATDESKSRRCAGVQAGSRDPERVQRVEGVGTSTTGGQQLPSSDKCGYASQPGSEEGGCAVPAQLELESTPVPARVPFPEDEFADLKMTKAEEMEFFLFCMQFDTLGNEDQLKLKWLSAKRSGQLYESEEDRQNGAALEALFAQPRHPGEPEAA